MHSNHLAKLAKVLARAFPEYDLRLGLASKAEVVAKAQVAGDALEAWRDIVHCSQSEGTLDVLIEAALFEQPENGDLKRFRRISEGESPRQNFGHLWVALALFAAGIAVFLLNSSESDIQVGEKAELVTAPAELAALVPIVARSAVEVSEPAQEQPVPVPPPLEALQPAPQSALGSTEGRCGGPTGSLVGYFYAGNAFSGGVGEPYIMKGDVNVRADYPRKENGWSSQSGKRCVLVRGDVLVLTKQGILVDGGKIWVPLHAGDLQRR
jgi:hypothetical protein